MIISIDPVKDTGILEKIKTAFVDYYVTNERNSRHLVDAIVLSPEILTDLELMLSGYKPKIIGMWNPDGTEYGTEKVVLDDGTEGIIGTPVYPFDKQEYLDMMPDEAKYDADGNIISTTRPTMPKEIHGWAGWKRRLRG